MTLDPCRPAQNASKIRRPPSPQRTKDLHVFWQPQKRADGRILKIPFKFNNLKQKHQTGTQLARLLQHRSMAISAA
ncbi:hypothetical protein [Rhizobium ecuadorense]|uniref:hypothetical protein n=1 Tax=Rhizobium ecuadorense TaxID=1671795 RepID=UPI00128F3D1D|nr:hypothetical protein [Rhizobium ecuadorense]